MSRITYKTLSLLIIALISIAASQSSARGLPAQDGILNFGKVSETIYRGAQPDADGIVHLEKLGVKMIINLRMPGDGWKDEESQAHAHGIVYTNVPLRGIGRPTDEQIQTVLKLIETLPGPVFIHCQHGCDRTGTIVACYRIKHDQWSREKALAEAVHYGMSALERGMKRYVADFATASRQLAKN